MGPPSGPSLLGQLLRSAAARPHAPSTRALGTQAFLLADVRALEDEGLRQGLAAWAASVRHPSDDEARDSDAARWEALLAEPLVQRLVAGEHLPPAQRLEHLGLLLSWPEPEVQWLRAHEGDLTRCAAHEVLRALRAREAASLAPVVQVPEAVWAHLPELAGPERPENAEALAALLPEALSPARLAEVLGLLAEGLERGLAAPGDGPVGALLSEVPGARGSLEALVDTTASGLRALASDIRAEPEDTPRAAQALVLGGLVYEETLRGLASLSEALLARHRGEPDAALGERRVRQGLVASGAALIGRVLASEVGAALGRHLARATETSWQRQSGAGRLPWGEPVLRVSGMPTPGLSAAALGEATGELLRLYTAQLQDLGDEAFELLGEALTGLLLSGQREGLDAAWVGWLGELSNMALLQDADAEVRAQVLRVLLVGGVLDVVSWEALAPALHARGPVFFERSLTVDEAATRLPEVYRASAALAVTVLADAFLLEDVRGGLLTCEEALAQARARGEALLLEAEAPVDAALARALLGACVPGARG